MGLAATAPLLLLLIPLVVGLIVGLQLLAKRGLGDARTRLALLVRALLVSALAMALAGVAVIVPADRLATIFVLDLSDSVGNTGRADALAFVRDALEERPAGDVAGVVAFGGDALVERLPDELTDLDRIASTPARGATDIGAALRLAAALFPDATQQRIVLLSDGNDTTGSGQVEAARAGARGIQVTTRTIGLGASDEVLIDRISVPTTSRLGEELEVAVEIRSTAAQPAAVRLYADGALVATERATLDAGVTRVVFRMTPKEAGFHVFRAVVEAARDTFPENDRADASTLVSGPPRVLVVSGDEAVAADLVTALETREGDVVTMLPELVPDDPATLSGFDSIVLVDVPRIRFTTRQLEALRSVTRDFGKGLVMIGGTRSYGAGGYSDTPLEAALPVEMRVRNREKQPDVALVVVIDESGSMAACHCNTFDRNQAVQLSGVRKVDIGKEAILRAAAALQATDELGVVAFNERANWVVKRSPLGSITDLQGSLGAINADGQTNIYAGLDEGVKALEGAKATRRHLILLTDGWSSSGQYDAILARMKAAGITLSTVGAGGGANPFLEQLAVQGGGRFYPAVNPASIPDIFLKETQQVSGQQIVEERFFPAITASSPIIRGLDAGFPSLLGYNGTTIKAAATSVLVSGRSDPVLAQWQYGLGRAVAWTSDATGRWARSWVGWNGFSRFFGQLVAWTFPGEEAGGIEARFVPGPGATTLRVESVGPDGSPRDFYATSVVMVDPGLEQRRLDLAQVAPGVYEAPIGELTPGAYALRVTQTLAGAAAVGRTLGLVAPSPAEYRLLGTNEPLLAAIRGATGGLPVTAAEDVWLHDLGTTAGETPLWPLLLVLALLLWPLDVFLRRVQVTRRDLASAGAWVREIPARRGRVAARPAPVEGMLAARDRAGGEPARAAIRRDAAAAPATGGGTRETAPAGSTDLPAPASPSTPSAATANEPADTLARLRDAKRRARR
ncbi:MAG TPA: VWA domain-containing protein [Candidatus Nanopelagicales bacterium]|nr:VWA domain-containing protein [Candidatus Nanopelagicales bacterium]